MAEHFLFLLFQLSVTLVLAANYAQAQSGFRSIDCGVVDTHGYKDETTGINYTSDANMIDTGEIHSISPEYKANSLDRQFGNLRGFPKENRNCYTFKAHGNSSQYLIRARFMYGNYDGKRSPPKFDIYVGATWWESVEFENASTVITKEILYVAPSELDYIHVCLCNTNMGIPFISVLEFRVLDGDTFVSYGTDTHLVHLARLGLGLQDHKLIRYPDDEYDRIWTPYNNSIEWKQISTSSMDYENLTHGIRFLPITMIRTEITPVNESDNIRFYFKLKPSRHNVSAYCVYTYHEEIQQLGANQTRDFRVYLNGMFCCDSTTLFVCDRCCHKGKEALEVWVNRTKSSTLPPILNAIEIFATRDLLQNRTNVTEYDAINNIRQLYGIKRNWQGDPCAPMDYIWDGIQCRHYGSGLHTIISLNLSSSGLNERIASHIAHLNTLEYLDLSDNSLTGNVPDFLSQLHSLRVLNLEGNQLSGPIPLKLLQKSMDRSLNFSFDGNPNLCFSGSCKKMRQNKQLIPLVTSLGAGGALILLAAVTFWIFKTKQSVAAGFNENKCFRSKLSKALDSNKQQFTYDEVVTITNNFGSVLGKGGFGTVFHGYLGNTQVAVKMLSPSVQGYQQFQAEAELLTKVHHKCLTALIGYCDEGTNVALIYEYMANGDLAKHLSAKSGKNLGWKARLQIVVDAAEGLEYLHSDCKPPIVHRDIKPQNILLNENLRGKLGDFGLSKIFPDEDDTHVSTVIAGTRGYLDPEYLMSNRLTEKSDVFSFGIVLLEIITGNPP